MDTKRTAIVTGSGTGVGAATALILSQRGWNVCINYSRSETEARETQARCGAAGSDTLLVQADVSDDAACRRIVDATVSKWGRLDALVNNAGVTTFVGTDNWDALDAAAFARILGVNVLGCFQMTRAARPHLKASPSDGGGAIVNVSSVAGSQGHGSSVPYVASKGGINSMTLHFARQLAPEIRVNAVCPGLITSRWFAEGVGQEGYEKIKAQYEQQVPLARASTPEDVAEAVVWLVHARTVTGELVQMDAGIHLGPRRSTVKPKT